MHLLFWKRIYTSKFEITIGVVPWCHQRFFVFSESRPAKIYKRLKTMESWKTVVSKSVAVAYERWSFTRGFNHRAMTEKHFVVMVRWWL